MNDIIPRLDIKEKSFHGTLVVGGLTGIVEGSVRNGFTLHTAFPGMMLTLLAAFLGGFTGFFIKDLVRTSRGMKPYRGVNNDGWMMGAFLGALIGTLLQVMISPDGANLIIGSIMGAYIGATFGAFPDEFVTPILLRMANSSSGTVAERKQLD
ncbi:hypothetical protein [Pseudodesulfovibrio sediminis]|uniref:Uncharacterized protein n=1 Tax=Pseudodesulfovibrio sediminis TaxID=2810563 RepID=A0ABM7P4L7_9BACT|nr:hypothetical protein [Pseudodesulfovibrio sediminis]BCS87721.1 hypothetical protein PSDVSF_09630 [Pseudodesulfovibrio sediminis]